MDGLPVWLDIALQIAIKVGSPFLLILLQKLMGNIPADVQALVAELVSNLQNPAVSNSQSQKAAAAKLDNLKKASS